MLRRVDDRRLGRSLGAIRRRLGLTQDELGIASGTSRHRVGRIERGELRGIDLLTVRAVASALNADVEVFVRWRGGDLGRLLNARHAALHEAVAARFAAIPPWLLEPEVSFSVHGERGVIDGLAWHAATGSLLIVELKTEIVDINDLMASMDRRMRLARGIAAERGWRASSVSCWVAIADSRTNRRRVARHAAVLRAKFPDDGRRLAGWLRQPSDSVRSLGFLSVAHVTSAGGTVSGDRRVRHARDSADLAGFRAL